MRGLRRVGDALRLKSTDVAGAAARNLHANDAVVGSDTGVIPGIRRAGRLVLGVVDYMIFNGQLEGGYAGDIVQGGCQCAVEGTNHVEWGLSVTAVVSNVSDVAGVADVMEVFVADVAKVSAVIEMEATVSGLLTGV